MSQSRFIFLAALALPTSAQSQQPQAGACGSSEHRALDFWVGEWIATDNQGKPIGTNRITRDEYGECVITEHFRMYDGSMIGHSVSTYRPGLKHWRQNWVDNQGGYFDLVGGPGTGTDPAFYFETKRVTETQPFQRMVFEDVKSDSFTWRWQSRKNTADSWADNWVIYYQRSKTEGK